VLQICEKLLQGCNDGADGIVALGLSEQRFVEFSRRADHVAIVFKHRLKPTMGRFAPSVLESIDRTIQG
jgi:hypothetical protein